MGIIKTSDFVNHPEGGILLRNGSIIKGYRPQQIVEETDNTLRLDATGMYFSLHKKAQSGNNSKGETDKQPTPPEFDEETLFLKNAWYFYEHHEEILADSRKFLARVPVQSGLAYTGTGGFRNPTLGIYVEWWHSCDRAVVELKGEKWLIWHIAGSPLSGSNKCSIVNASGKTKIYTVSPFSPVWSTFMQVNTRYDECKHEYMSYDLKEVVMLMRGGMDERSKAFVTERFGLRSQVAFLAAQLKNEKQENEKLRHEFAMTKVKYNESELRTIYNRYQNECDLRGVRRTQLLEDRNSLRAQFKAEVMSQTEYQRALWPINKEAKELAQPPKTHDIPLLNDLGLTISDLIDYFEKKD